MCDAENILKALEAEVEKARAVWNATPECDRVPPAFFRRYMQGLTRAKEVAAAQMSPSSWERTMAFNSTPNAAEWPENTP